MNDNNIIIGPVGVGKSTVAPEVARKLGKKHVHMDKLREKTYERTDYSEELAEKVYE